MRSFIIFIFALALVNLCAGDVSELESFKDTQIYQVTVQNEQQLNKLWKLTQDLKLEVLHDFQVDRREYQIVVDPANRRAFKQRLSELKCHFRVLIDNFINALKDRFTSAPESKMEWTQYHQLDDIYSWLDNLADKYRGIVKNLTIGFSYEGRPIKAAILSLKKGNKAVVVECGIHAIEWISSAAGTCFFNKLLTSNDPELRQLLWGHDWVFVPMLNPDGFEYSHNVQPLWRKNRKPTGFTNSSGMCNGTDLNRNFNFMWNGAGYNVKVPCDHWYGGAEPDSEPEVQAMQKFVKSFPKGYICMYLALHSFGNLCLLPYGHSAEVRPKNYDQMMRFCNAFADGVYQKYNTTFKSGSSSELLNAVSGASKDWAYGVMGIPFTATIELRDTGEYGFFLPAAQIGEVCNELTDGIVSLMKAAKKEHFFDKCSII